MSHEDARLSITALNVLLNFSKDETIRNDQDMNLDETVQLNLSTISPSLPYVSYVRGSESSNRGTWSISDENALMFKESLSFKNEELSETVFFDSGTGKNTFLQDLDTREKELTLQNENPDYTGCSSWTLYSQKKIANAPLLASGGDVERSLCVSIGEYIGARCETIESFFEDASCQNSHVSYETSTPINKNKSFNFVIDMEERDFFCPSMIKNDQDTAKYQGSPLRSALLYSINSSTTKIEKSLENPYYFINTPARRHIERLRTEERMKIDNRVAKLALESLQTDEIYGKQSSNISETSDGDKEENIASKWTVEPQVVTLDSTKGARVVLINNSDQDLKFKAKFNGRLTSICPLSGTVRAMDQVGLRILMSQCVKKKDENIFIDDVIKIVLGKTEKNIHVKIIKELKPKTLKKRCYALH